MKDWQVLERIPILSSPGVPPPQLFYLEGNSACLVGLLGGANKLDFIEVTQPAKDRASLSALISRL